MISKIHLTVRHKPSKEKKNYMNYHARKYFTFLNIMSCYEIRNHKYDCYIINLLL